MGRIYLLSEDGALRPMSETEYASEDLLQRLVEEHPALLAGELIDAYVPRRWLVLAREMGVPLEADGADTLSLDHLLVDQDAVPTLVEVKRSSDSRLRRQVVGQLLDYAAHAVAYWSGESLRARFEASCEAGGADPEQQIIELLQAEDADDLQVDAFWERLDTNLKAGRVRLLFVADEVPRELRRVVEFLNRFMDPVEVLAVEIKQYTGHGLRTLVPRVIGETKAEATGAGSSNQQWTEPRFFAELRERNGSTAVEVAERILAWARSRGLDIWWGKGARNGSFVPNLDQQGRNHQLFAVWTTGSLETYFYWYQYKPPFDTEERRLEILDKLNAVDGIDLPRDSISRRPGIPLTALHEEDRLTAFLAVYDWFVAEVRAS